MLQEGSYPSSIIKTCMERFIRGFATQLLTTRREEQRSDTLCISTEQQQSPIEIKGNHKSCLTSLTFGLVFLQREKITEKKGPATTLQC